MSKFIEVTLPNMEKVILNPNGILWLQEKNENTNIHLLDSASFFTVNESYNEIEKMLRDICHIGKNVGKGGR